MRRVGKPTHGIRARLFYLIIVVLFPLLIIQAYFHYDRFETRRAEELQSNLVLARAVGVAFNGLIQDILRQEIAVAIVVMDTPSHLPLVLPQLLRESARNYPVRSFSWIGPDGRVLFSSKPKLEGMDISDREFFQELLSGREWFVSDLVLSKASGEPIFSIGRSVRDAKGDLLGFVLASLDAQGVEQALAFERPNDAGISLMDRKGRLVATYPAKELTWEERNWLKLYPQKLQNPLKGIETTSVVLTSTGEKRLVGAVPVSSIGWVAASSRSEDAVFGTIQSALLAEGSLFLFVTLAAFATALSLSRPISGSIVRLRDRVLALGRGDQEDLTIPPCSTSELNELAQSFSAMVEKVRNREKALRESEKRYREIVETAEEGIATHEPDGTITYINQRMADMLGYPREEIIGRSSLDFLDEEEREAVIRARESLKERGSFSTERRMRRKDGSNLWTLSNITPRRDGHGNFLGYLAMHTDITERKRIEEEVRKNREDLNRAQALAHIGSWRLDVGRNEVTWSDETYRMFGVPEGEPLTYEKFLSLVHPGDREFVDREWSSALKGKTYDIEHRIIVVNNTKWVREKAELEFNGDGSLRGGFGAVQDITEKKQVEANRALLNETLRIFNCCSDMKLLVSDTLRLLRNTSGFDAVGLRLRRGEDYPYFEHDGFSAEFLREENFLCNKGLDGAISRDAEGRAVLECTCGVVLTGRTDPNMSCFTEAGSFWTNASHEFLALPAEADPRTNPRNRCIHAGYESVGLFPVRAGGDIMGLLQLNGRNPGRFTPALIIFYENLAQNIGLALQRIMAENALRESEEKFRNLYDEAPVGYIELNSEGRVDRVNKKMSEMLGYSADEMVGEPMWAFVVEEKEAEEAIRAKLAGHEDPSIALERNYKTKNGPPIPVIIKDRIVRNGEGGVTRVRVTVQDITERKRMEEDLRRSRDELESRVRERTIELESKNRELREFTYAASHDLNEPLRKIQVFGDLLTKTSANRLGEQGREFVSRMTGAANRMQMLLEALLRYSRLETRGGDFKRLKLNDVVKGAAADLEIALRDAGAQLKIGSLPSVIGDPYQLRQVFQNLIGNAAKYHRSEVKPLIKIYGEEYEGAYHILVEDNGIGFDEKYSDKIFQPFQRLHGKHEYPGTGIGLSICRKVVESHGGTIKAKSTIGKGSTFIITLPVKE
ncbi:MAG: PAS domain S-box protein [Desulfobacteraceae bacterium]|nr:MAG: PAS domain S-box protein [Desulfobacteraceae bacterium]